MDQLEKCPLKVVLRPFISNIHEAYAAADLVVARAGAMTCAEMLSRGLPALFIPYPHASGHQEMNARALETAGAAVVITEKELEEEKLSQTLISLLSDRRKLKTMGEAAPQASQARRGGGHREETFGNGEKKGNSGVKPRTFGKIIDPALREAVKSGVQFHRYRRGRHERHRGGALEPALRSDRVGPEGFRRDR